MILFPTAFSAARDSQFGVGQKPNVEPSLEHPDNAQFQERLHALTSPVETADPYKAGHGRPVAKLAVAIAKEMRLPNGQIEGIRVAATVHDLGKLQIPAEIVSKPDALTPQSSLPSCGRLFREKGFSLGE